MTIEIHQNIFIRVHRVRNPRLSVWFIHGFGDSGLAYREAFESSLTEKHNLFVVDMPGFGASPLNHSCVSIREQARLLGQIIRAECGNAPIAIVAHSMGGLIGTWLCQQFGDQVACYVNLEGNLTEADSYFSGKSQQYEIPEMFFTDFKQEVFEIADTSESYRRYYSSLSFSQPQALANWGSSSLLHVKNNACGKEFKGCSCAMMY